jgi:putative SOS response-associated peptidase YedK
LHWTKAARCSPSRAYGGFGQAKRKGETAEHSLFAFLTTQSNDVVRPIHAKAMPVLLTTEQEFDTWLDAPVDNAIALQRPLPNELLRIVAKGEKSDPVAAMQMTTLSPSSTDCPTRPCVD